MTTKQPSDDGKAGDRRLPMENNHEPRNPETNRTHTRTGPARPVGIARHQHRACLRTDRPGVAPSGEADDLLRDGFHADGVLHAPAPCDRLAAPGGCGRIPVAGDHDRPDADRLLHARGRAAAMVTRSCPSSVVVSMRVSTLDLHKNREESHGTALGLL